MKDLNTLCPKRVLGTGDWIPGCFPAALTLYPLLRVAPVPWLQDLHAVTAVHPLWFHVRSGLGRSSGWAGRCGWYLNDDDIADIYDVPSNEPKPSTDPGLKTGAVERISETMQALHSPTHNAKT